MFDIVLFQPEIPPNTGNVIRLAANAGAHLHLVEPLGFVITDRTLARAGLDYHDMTQVTVHKDWDSCVSALSGRRFFALTTKARARYDQVAFQPGDVFVFGPESRGLPAEILDALPSERRLRIPMRPGCRSMNLSNSVAVLVLEAWRQQGFAGGA
ncbi:tRNA (uridine(34)/cytosine(34)/5-carboxymethylaminomethyluridine(34)-2'-O)-methyltransferase TrmL [Azoarcus indigens]|uniref:tRNA (cytidine(34)-2'-O)-methyltransferase n=1 Tax=Azoarcus indigens TaxID=29545 RepID=A0A4R6DRI6_9RHOO|nr:tRNA (cytidine(34)-2'-O)-methyltransferase [Azoarcus indigens]NMG66316.1 tRNA (uridine(34)/cytosine(34)/5-carboxymethylaminomethyluridine(34)-2'-O)-methyltransferase TrmL [Azoarcus indigens]TDN47573.1 tRNA (cytidine/uridine-2'-O-)-methyltransferase [Azoarcus indigens]